MTPAIRILALGAHPDDIELGCGGTLAKLVSQGAQVRAVILTSGLAGASVIYDRNQETHSALTTLGVQEIFHGSLPDTGMQSVFNDTVNFIEQHVCDFKPDRVYTMFEHDRHQDHRTTFQASIIASRQVRQVLCYETPSAWPNFEPSLYEVLDDEHLQAKIKAIRMHTSQQHRDYMQPNHLTVNAMFRGQQMGLSVPCEGFIPYKFVL